ncbi:hypothetical protein SAMN05444159_0195 [Bradyrhizobium lablabi]|uniref:Uncharacterized protein n=1 Tax=Bradyrhizobium lablabi TaxID=722472 RepID=A0A1M6I2F0_9BRAD|nr:hypothetical protein [Bradyrhizobium lablabi]SHJ28404.1 hypothetical protein SAMN05444159_0195 [Bradyrhizobium lablabi]
MFDHKLRKTWILLWLGVATAAPAGAADGPSAGFKLDRDADVFKSPDGTVRFEQYAKKQEDGGRLFQFWTFDRDHRHAFQLNPDENDDLPGYPAGFRFSPDSQWLVRMQKLGAGSQTLFLYRRNGFQFSPATKKPFGELAWDYFFTTPTSKGMHRDPENPYGLDHATVNLIKGMEENYAWMGQHWPDSRYVVVGLSFDMQGEEVKAPWIEGWHCVYDLKTGAFSVPPDFAKNNAESVKYPDPK